ncbi:hypothetical protein EMCG_05915 [[Emmonsia] crescens]|uniref:C2H2-type domain-containing protein n=1 Tax=[Emmonsia] crescens TaxID=73230 RepID=A0A0G2JC18_9EURO|nr:hypothetical protein EMCG_05915 [Emmonsia crescens UAMH 3008]
MSTKTRPRLDPVPVSWISTSKRHHAALDDDVGFWSDSLCPKRTLPFDHGSQPHGDDARIAQEGPQDIIVPEAFWHALTFKIPQASLEFDEIYKIQLQQDYRRLGFVGRIPNFSRPFRSLLSVRDMDDALPGPHAAGKKPKSQEINKQAPLAVRETETVVAHSYSEAQSLDHFQRGVSSSTSDSSMTIQGRDENHHKWTQPCSQTLLETIHPPGPPQIPNDYPNIPINISLSLSSDNPETLPPPEPPPPEQQSCSSASRTLRKLRGYLRTPSYETPSRNSNHSFTQTQSQTEDVKPKAESRLISSWPATIKQALNYFPRRQKDEPRHEAASQDLHVTTNRSSWRSSAMKTSYTGRDIYDRSPSIRSKVVTREAKHYTSKPSTSILSNTTSSSYEKLRLPLKVSTTPLTALEEFQCTFCLLQCENKTGWLRHEEKFHLEDLENFSRPHKHKEASRDEISSLGSKLSRGKSRRRLLTKSPPQPSSSSSRSQPSSQNTGTSNHSNHGSERQGANIFWNCGFCDELLRSWEDRQTHLAGHFSNGETMRMWDPMKSPFPWRRGSAGPVDTPPHWDLPSLLTLQRPTLQDSINQIGTSHDQRKTTADTCKSCHVPHPSLEHFDLWHQPRDTYTCPRITDFTNLADFFDEDDDESGEMTVDWCNACDERLDRPDYLDRETRMQHLWDFHGFGDCVGWVNFLDEGQFVLHLANAHAVNIDHIRRLVRLCRKIGDAPASMAMDGDF